MIKIKNFLSPKEIIIIAVSVIISGVLASSVWWYQAPNPDAGKYEYYGYDMLVRTATGGDVQPFHTTYEVIYDKTRPESEKAQVQEVIAENVPFLHKIADRVNLYYLDDNNPGLGYLTTIKDVNESYGSPDFLEVPFDLYNVLSIGKEMTIASNSTFNMFIGELSDFWNNLIDDEDYPYAYETMDPFYNATERAVLERYQACLPLSEAEVNAILELKEENNKYYVRFNQFKDAVAGEISITLGGIAKGYANDIVSSKLTALGLTHGAIVGGASSNTTLGDRYGDTVWTWTLEAPTTSSDYSFKIIRNGAYGMSTSGAYMGIQIPIDENDDGVAEYTVLRNHIIDPYTGYPSVKQLEVNILSHDISGARLDALSTAFICMSETEGMALRQHYLDQGYEFEAAWCDDVAAVGSVPAYLEVRYTEGYDPFIGKSETTHYLMIME